MKMKRIKKIVLQNLQTALVFLILFGFNSKLHASSKKQSQYKVEQCDCLGYKDDIPLFLSDITEADIFNIAGEGSTRRDAEKQVENMCVALYKKFESSVDNSLVSHSGCYTYKKNSKNQWELI